MKRLLLILIIAISALYPQNITVDNNKDFDKALSLYNSKKYSDALDLFKRLKAEQTTIQKIVCLVFLYQKF